jgi:hypothetical protein
MWPNDDIRNVPASDLATLEDYCGRYVLSFSTVLSLAIALHGGAQAQKIGSADLLSKKKMGVIPSWYLRQRDGPCLIKKRIRLECKKLWSRSIFFSSCGTPLLSSKGVRASQT